MQILIDDQNGAWDLTEKRLDCVAPVAQKIGALLKSFAKYPNIEPGEEFAGCK